MLSWIQHTISNEKEMLETLLRGCSRQNADPKQSNIVLSSISGALCQPLRVIIVFYKSTYFYFQLRIEQCITKESNCVILYRLSNLLLYFSENYRFIKIIGLWFIRKSRETLLPEAHLLVCCRDLHELCSNMFYSSISSAMQRILGNVHYILTKWNKLLI